MTYLEKLIKLEGGKKPDILAYHQKINNIKTEELAARSMFRGLISLPSERKKAVKLGLVK